MKPSKTGYKIHLNRQPIPDHEKKCRNNYGSYLYRNDPIAFDVGYQEWSRSIVETRYRQIRRRYEGDVKNEG